MLVVGTPSVRSCLPVLWILAPISLSSKPTNRLLHSCHTKVIASGRSTDGAALQPTGPWKTGGRGRFLDIAKPDLRDIVTIIRPWSGS